MDTVEPSAQPMQDLLKGIDVGRIQLPDIQRDFKWARSQIKALLDTVQRNHPTGSLLFLRTARDGAIPFGAAPFKFADVRPTTRPEFLVLDGQQRLTSCYVAMFNKGRPKEGSSYYIDLQALHQAHRSGLHQADELEFEQLLLSKPWEQNPAQYLSSQHMLPLALLRRSDTQNQPKEFLRDALKAYRNELRPQQVDTAYYDFIENDLDGYLEPFFSYAFPVVILPSTLSLAAVCKIFVTINTSGLRLGAFDLCVASLAPQNVNLKALWAEARQNELVRAVDSDGTNVLQTVALLADKGSKKASLPSTITRKEIDEQWPAAVRGVELAAMFIGDFGGGTPPRSEHLPYDGIVPALAAVLLRLEQAKLSDLARLKAKRVVTRWYFGSALGQRYNEGTDVLQQQDAKAVYASALGTAGPSSAGLESQPWSLQVWANASPTGAIGKAMKCLLSFKGAVDPLMLASSAPGQSSVVPNLHHLFPRGFMKSVDPDQRQRRQVASVLNQTFLAAETNRLLKDHAPSQYLPQLIAQMRGDSPRSEAHFEAQLRKVLRDHHLVSDEAYDRLRTDDFAGFIEARARTFAEEFSASFGVELKDISDLPGEDEAVTSAIESGESDDSGYLGEEPAVYAAGV